MIPQDTTFGTQKNSRNIHRIYSMMPCEPGTFLLFVAQDEKEVWHASSLTCLGFALVETWREDQGRQGHPDTYVGPSWIRSIVPVYQDIEGILMPYNDDGDSSSGSIIVTPMMPESEVFARFKVLNIDKQHQTTSWCLVQSELMARRRARP